MTEWNVLSRTHALERLSMFLMVEILCFFTTYIENLDELCHLEIRPFEPHPGCCSSDIHLRLLGCRNEIPS